MFLKYIRLRGSLEKNDILSEYGEADGLESA